MGAGYKVGFGAALVALDKYSLGEVFPRVSGKSRSSIVLVTTVDGEIQPLVTIPLSLIGKFSTALSNSGKDGAPLLAARIGVATQVFPTALPA